MRGGPITWEMTGAARRQQIRRQFYCRRRIITAAKSTAVGHETLSEGFSRLSSSVRKSRYSYSLAFRKCRLCDAAIFIQARMDGRRVLPPVLVVSRRNMLVVRPAIRSRRTDLMKRLPIRR